MRSKGSVIFVSFLIFWLIFAPKSAIIPDTAISGWITNIVCLFLLWSVRHDLKHTFTKRNRTFNILLLTYLAVAVFSEYYNASTINQYELTDLENAPRGVASFKYLFVYSIGLFASSLYIQRISHTKYIRILLKTLFILFLIVLVPTYIEVITTPIEKGTMTEYRVGNKFNIGYYHLYLCAIFCLIHPYLNQKKHKYCLLLFLGLMILSSFIAQCSTMIVGALIFMFLSMFISDTIRNRLASAKVVIISVLVFDIGFFFLVTWILQYDSIQYIVTNILHRDLTLTGRLPVYLDIQEAFTESPWIGLGYGNSTVVSKYFTDAYDSQNGLVELFIQTGLIGVVVFLSLLYTAFKTFEKNNIPKLSMVALIYAMIVISTVEIPFKLTFVFFLSFCFIRRRRYPKALLELIRAYNRRKILAKIKRNRIARKKKSSIMMIH